MGNKINVNNVEVNKPPITTTASGRCSSEPGPVAGFTFSHAEGHGVQVEHDPFLSTRDKVVGYTPRVRVDILLEDDDVDPVLETLRNTTYGVKDHGIYWVTDVEHNGRL